MLALSWVAAILACLGYGVGSVLQAVGARRTAHVAGLSSLALILVQLPYLFGLVGDGLAFLANIVALQQLPLFLVQSIVTASVGVTAVIAHFRGERLRWPSWLSLAVLGGGLVIMVLTANPAGAVSISILAQWIILASVVVPVTLGLIGLRLSKRYSALVLAAAAGLAWTAVALASRGISANQIGLDLLGRPLLWTIVVQGVVGGVFFALALQRGSVTAVTAMTFVLEMIIPSVLGLVLFGDTVEAGTEIFAILGFLMAVGGTVSVMRFAEPPVPIEDELDQAQDGQPEGVQADNAQTA